MVVASCPRRERNRHWKVEVLYPACQSLQLTVPSVYLDDGVSVSPNATKVVAFSASSGSITASVAGSYVDGNALSNITIMGVETAPSSTGVTLNGKSVGNGVYDAASKTFFIGNLDQATSSGAWAADWTLVYGSSGSGSASPSSASVVSQISDGQPQAPAKTTTSGVVSQLSDGQPQATKSA